MAKAPTVSPGAATAGGRGSQAAAGAALSTRCCMEGWPCKPANAQPVLHAPRSRRARRRAGRARALPRSSLHRRRRLAGPPEGRPGAAALSRGAPRAAPAAPARPPAVRLAW
eukprot:7123809-Lingulodinium_polyedra.AAC.1